MKIKINLHGNQFNFNLLSSSSSLSLFLSVIFFLLLPCFGVFRCVSVCENEKNDYISLQMEKKTGRVIHVTKNLKKNLLLLSKYMFCLHHLLFFHVWSVSLIIIIIIISYMVFLIGQFIFNIEYQRFVCSFVFFLHLLGERRREKFCHPPLMLSINKYSDIWIHSFLSILDFFFAIVCFQCFLGLTSFIYLMIRFFF